LYDYRVELAQLDEPAEGAAEDMPPEIDTEAGITAWNY
jgi:hypothetical protein